MKMVILPDLWLCRSYLLKVSFFPESSTQAHTGKNVVAEALQHPAPSEMAFKISGRHAMKARQPLLEPAVIGIDALDVIRAPDDADDTPELQLRVAAVRTERLFLQALLYQPDDFFCTALSVQFIAQAVFFARG